MDRWGMSRMSINGCMQEPFIEVDEKVGEWQEHG